VDKTLKTFPVGGIHPEDNKLSANKPIANLPLPETVAIPISQHIGAPAKVIVNVGDNVKVGQVIAESSGFVSANIHSSVSGTVTKVGCVMDVTGYRKRCVVIKVEGDEWLENIDRSPDVDSTIIDDIETIIKKVSAAGIVGLGGATFPSHVKLTPPHNKKIEYLLINGVECEPYLTSDHRLMLEKTEEIMVGIHIILKTLGINCALVGIESNKEDAIKKMQDVAKDFSCIEVHGLKMQYPQGGERQLIKALLNEEVPPPPQGLPHDVGCAVFNVGTVFAIYEAVQKNKPLFERIVTITGKSFPKPSNFRVRIGTSVSKLIEAGGGLPEDAGKVVSGGPMMGKALNQVDVPVTKGMSGLVVFKEQETRRKEILNCIRCAKCVTGCPLGLEPYLLMALTEKGIIEQAEKEKILNCCECGCCSYECPSNRPLLDYMRLGKTEIMKMRKARSK